jgi:hypothetical protein
MYGNITDEVFSDFIWGNTVRVLESQIRRHPPPHYYYTMIHLGALEPRVVAVRYGYVRLFLTKYQGHLQWRLLEPAVSYGMMSDTILSYYINRRKLRR